MLIVNLKKVKLSNKDLHNSCKKIQRGCLSDKDRLLKEKSCHCTWSKSYIYLPISEPTLYDKPEIKTNIKQIV